ncbi:MAPEG family protein [Methylocystis heyeri]|uniref:Glutathione metabolism protein n=1 Tax=Methylocystis heyeri TaxID=391905 RepID=A0A6B8KL95_9HYPH|nr:MAPEG family protein [Methylocystis heyeri]QGM47403.1 glutathione metabolism protein [Methylocystis heyeri]
MPITAFYASLLTPLFLVLAVRVVAVRKSARVALGDGGDRALLRRIRAHANFAEYVPLALVLMGLAESLSASAWLLHGTGVALLAGRALHAFSVSRQREDIRHRVAAMLTTFAVLAILAATCFVLSARRAFMG